jgi:hypothetical protein
MHTVAARGIAELPDDRMAAARDRGHMLQSEV